MTPTSIETAWARAKAAPVDTDAWQSLCRICLASGDLEGARASIDHLEAMGLGDVGLWRSLAEAFETRAAWAEAQRAWRRVIDETPRDSEPYRRLAAALSKAGEVMLAVLTLEVAMRLAPDEASTHRMLARAQVALGAHARAKHHAARARDLDPDHPTLPGLVELTGIG